MSADVLKIIPDEAMRIPDPSTHKKAEAILKEMLPDGEMCEANVYSEVQFIDQGENLESVLCPACGKRIELDWFTEDDSAAAWWYGTLDSLASTSGAELEATMPCCKATVPFTTLEFDWPAGFARFELCIWNPNLARSLNDAEMAKLEATLGCGLKQVRAHY